MTAAELKLAWIRLHIDSQSSFWMNPPTHVLHTEYPDGLEYAININMVARGLSEYVNVLQ